VPATRGLDFSGVLHFFDGHNGFVSEMLSVSLFASSSIEAFGFMACPRDMLPASFRCPVSLLIHTKQQLLRGLQIMRART
jgi:hypothetical protein